MKITQSSDSELIMRNRPWLLGGFLWLLGLVALYAGITGHIEDQGTPPILLRLFVGALGLGAIAIAWWAFPFQTFRFDRVRGLFTCRTVRVLCIREDQIPLALIIRAVVEQQRDDGVVTQRLALERHPQGGQNAYYPLEFGFGSVPREQLAAQINDWLGVAT